MGKAQQKATKANGQSVSKTLFLRNLPFDVSNEKLTDVFKQYGPIQSCFVVNDAITKKSRGIGYVKYTDSDDAAKALRSVKDIDGRKVFVSFANAKAQPETRKPKDKDSPSTEAVAGRNARPSSHRLMVRNIPFSMTQDKLKDWCSAESTQVSAIELPTTKDGKAKGYAFLFVEDKESGDQFISSFNKKLLGGRNVSVDWFVKESEFNKLSKKDKTKSTSTSSAVNSKGVSETGFRLIIRNLPFQISEDTLKKSLKDYGDVSDIKFPTNEKGRKKGFAFATFSSKENAEKVISGLKEVNKRPVAVDWAVDKSVYVTKLSASKDTSSKKSGQLDATQSDKHQTPIDSKSKAMSSGKDNKLTAKNSPSEQVNSKQSPSKQVKSKQTVSKQSPSNDSESDDDDSVTDSDEEQVESSENENESYMSHSDSNDNSESDSEEEEEADYEDMDDEDDSGVSDGEKKVKHTVNKPRHAHKTSSADISQERTLFLRNVSYETTEDQLIEVFSQFGDVAYVKVLVDSMTERSKGMAFVQYDSKEMAEECMAATQDPQQKSQFFVDGRDLNVALAVSREKIGELNKAKEKQPKDKRNLYLAREGQIRDGTKAAEGVSKLDMNKRMKLESTMRAKLKNPLIFISPLRLCIHNLPVKLTDKQLKGICLKAAAQGKAARVTECRIMRDLTRVNAEGVGKSKGYGFVAFSEHQHALAALRNLNNNPDIFTNEKRPIVEFSLENTKALQAKEKRQQTAKSLLSGNTKSNPTKDSRLVTTGAQAMIERPKGVKPGLPSHHGPKVRHKPRPTTEVDTKKQAKLARKRKEQEINRKEKEENKQPKPKKQKVDTPDSFDKLVNAYRSKMSAGVTAKAKSKWYE